MRRSSFIFVTVLLAIAVLSWTGAYLSTPGGGSVPSFTVAKGESADSIANRLKQDGFIRSVWVFKLTLRQSGLEAKLQPGEYRLDGAETYGDIIARLAAGGVAANELVLKVIEGWDLRDIQAELRSDGFAAVGDWFAAVGDPLAGSASPDLRPSPDYSGIYSFLKDKPKDVSLEGYLFPDTYRVFKDAKATDVVRTLLANLKRRLNMAGLLDSFDQKGRNLHQVLTMASIVEKEVRTDADRPLVADIFWRRLEAGMPLQADSTVNYVTGKNAAAASSADLAADSPYNTYRHPGLPPGPICNPGLKAIEAALKPEPNSYWYFLTDPAGGVHYARTLDEHNANKAKYLK